MFFALHELFRRKWFRLVALIGGWSVIGTLFAIQSYTYRIAAGVPETTWWGLYFREMFFFLLWAAFTPAVVWASRQFRFERNRWLSLLLVHLLLGISVAVVQRAVYEAISLSYFSSTGDPFSWRVFFKHILAYADYGYFLYCIIVVVVHATDYSRKLYDERLTAARLREDLAQAQLKALKMQIQPHFLFNTLNAIAILIREEPETASRMVGHLSDLLRMTLQSSADHEIPLRQELELLQRYLEIEKIRFGNRLTVATNVDDALLDTPVPALILQPLVENSIRHGIARRREPGFIEISAVRQNGSLHLSVRDNGSGLYEDEGKESSSGIGLSNTRGRLLTLYGEKATFALRSAEAGGTIAEVDIPLPETEQDS